MFPRSVPAIKKVIIWGIYFGFLLGVIFNVARAAQPKMPISVKAEVSNAFITIGDPVKYTVTIKRNPKIKIVSAIPLPSKDIFQIKKINEFKREEDGMSVEGRSMVLTTFRLGEFVLDPVKIEYKDESGQAKSIETEKIYLTVQSVAKGEEKKDIRGVKPVVSIPQHYKELVIILAAFLLVLVIGINIYAYVRKRRHTIQSPAVILTPGEEALLHLDQLFESDLLKRGRYKEYYLKLSSILKIYFEKRYTVSAVESTTYEIIKLLKERNIDPVLMEKIIEVLGSADLAKFAKWKPEPVTVMDINKKSKEIVEQSKPIEPDVQGTEHAV